MTDLRRSILLPSELRRIENRPLGEQVVSHNNRLVQVLWFPEITLLAEGTHVFEENATLVHLQVKKSSAFVPVFWKIVGRQVGS